MTTTSPPTPARPWAVGLRDVLREIAEERSRQFAKWGGQQHPDVDVMVAGLPGHQVTRYAASFYGIPTAPVAKAETDAAARAGACSWTHIAVEEVCEAVEAGALGDLAALRGELVQAAAVFVQWIQDVDRRLAAGGAR